MIPEPSTSLIRTALSPQRVLLTEATNKVELLNVLVDSASDSKHITSTTALRTAIHERESLMSTGIGLGIGVPHARLDAAKDLVMAMALNKTILPDYEAIDGGPVRIVFLVAARPDQQTLYIRILSAISRLVKDAAQRDRIYRAATAEDLYALITRDAHG